MPVINGAALALLDNLDVPEAVAEAEGITQSLREHISLSGGEVDELGWIKELKPHWELGGCESSRVPIIEMTKQGVYFQHLLCLVEQSPYTKGLEEELQSLLELPNLADSALGAIVSSAREYTSSSRKLDLLNVLPSNTEQEKAVQSALQDKLGVIQGPPGTGKSQVIAQAIVNAVEHNQTVLFVSKNNQAVDIVEKRVNELSRQPLVLRLRPGSVRRQVVAYLDSHLTPSGVSLVDRQRAKSLVKRTEQKMVKVEQSIGKYIEARNWLIENLDEQIDKSVISSLSNLHFTRLTTLTDSLMSQAEGGRVASSLRWLEFKAHLYLLRRKGLQLEEGEELEELQVLIDNENIRRQKIRHQTKLGRNNLAERLSKLDTFSQKVRHQTLNLWSLKVAVRSSNIDDKTRMKLEEYKVSSRLEKRYKTQNQKLTDLFSYIKSQDKISPFPAWSTTLLSLKRTTPLIAGLFDVVIFDEASQCDIASALPALARAKRAVVIGDPKQLSHITPHSLEHEKSLLRSYRLSGKDMRWSYTQNSLFDLVQSSIPLSRVNLLRDHHRSHSDIIGFSNQYFYGSMLRPRTDPARFKVESSDCGVAWDDTGSSRVERPKSGSLRNLKEARRVIRVLEQAVDKYPEANIGIVTPFRAQAEYIKGLIESRLSQELIDRLELRVGTVHTFQGDEKDIVIFSPVVAEGMSDGQVRFISQAGNLFNVAITRARSRFVVVGDLLFARTNQIPFYSSFVNYVIEHDKTRTKKRADVVYVAQPTDSMESFIELVRSKLVSGEESAYEVLDVGKANFEAVRLSVGGRSMVLILDHLQDVMLDGQVKEVLDKLGELIKRGSINILTNIDELQYHAGALGSRIEEMLSRAKL